MIEGRALRIAWDEFTWRRLANVALICFVLSTQVLFQPNLLRLWTPEAIARGWFDYFAEAFACGVAMWVAVALATTLAGDRRGRRTAAAIVALVTGALIGSLIAMLALQPAGFYPTPGLFVGDALRWAIFGAVTHFAHEQLRVAARQAAAVREASIERESLDRRMVEAHLEVLRAQIEPHFLFNTLAHVKRLYASRPETGDEMLASLRRYLEAALPHMRGSRSDLGREVDLVRAYLNILRLRLGSRLAFSIAVPDALRTQDLPPMMLITLVENAVKHGIAPRQEGGTIEVRARTQAGFMEVEVADTGMGFQGTQGSGIGLANIRSRLRGLYGSSASLSLMHNQPRGVISRLRVPAAPAGSAAT